MLNVIEKDNTLTFKFDQRMDTFKSQEIESELNAWVKETNGKVIFDLENVLYISSYFLRICLNTMKAVGKERFTIKNVRSDIQKAFTIAGFDKQLVIK